MRASIGNFGKGLLEASGLLAILVVVLWQSPYGELGLEVDRFFHLQWLALLALCGALWCYGSEVGHSDSRAFSLGNYFETTTAIEKWAWAWAATAIVAAVFSVDTQRSLLGATPRLGGLSSELAVLGLGLLLARQFAQREARDRVEQALVLGVALLTSYGWLQVAGLDPILWQEDWQGRPISSQGNPLFLGQLLVWLIPLLAGRAVLAWSERRRRASVAAMALALAATGLAVATRSRGALLGLLVAAVVLIVLILASSADRRMRRLALTFILLAGLLAGLAVGYLLPRVEDLGGTVAQRLLLWRAAGDLLADGSPGRLMMGYGQESLALIVPAYLPAELPGRIWQPDLYHDRAHNAALDAFVARGALGAIAGLGLLVSGLITAVQLVRRSAAGTFGKTETYRVIALAAGLAGQSVALLTGVSTAAGFLVGWVALALLSGYRCSGNQVSDQRMSKRSASEAEARRRRLAAVTNGLLGGVALALVAFAVWAPQQVGEGRPLGRPAPMLAMAAFAVVLAWASGERMSIASWWRATRIAGLWITGYLLIHALLLVRPEPGIGLLALAEMALLLAGLALARSIAKDRVTAGGRALRLPKLLAGVGTLVLFVVAAMWPVRGLSAGVRLKEGRTALIMGDLDLAIERLEESRRLAPWLEDAPLSLVRARLRRAGSSAVGPGRDREFYQASEELAALARSHPRSTLFPLELGHLHARWADGSTGTLRDERFSTAESFYRQALASDPRNAMAHRGLGATLLGIGREAEAVEELATSARLAPRSMESQFLLGRAHLAVGDLEAALSSFSLGRDIDPRRARSLLEGLARAQPRDPTLLRDLAVLEIVEGRREPALAVLRAAMATAPPEEMKLLVRLTSLAGRLP